MWQPIETAPKDGTVFLVFCPMEGGAWWWIGPAMWIDDPAGEFGGSHIGADGYPKLTLVDGWEIMTGDCPEVAATHWMPMPPPPPGAEDVAEAIVQAEMATWKTAK